jgi:hypothetical protein
VKLYLLLLLFMYVLLTQFQVWDTSIAMNKLLNLHTLCMVDRFFLV